MSIDLERFPWSDSAKRMLTYVTKDWYEKSYVGKWASGQRGSLIRGKTAAAPGKERHKSTHDTLEDGTDS